MAFELEISMLEIVSSKFHRIFETSLLSTQIWEINIRNSQITILSKI